MDRGGVQVFMLCVNQYAERVRFITIFGERGGYGNGLAERCFGGGTGKVGCLMQALGLGT